MDSIAILGGATAFVESTLAQLWKVREGDAYRGGPAYYISQGLGSRQWASVFAVVITFVFGFAYEATQANTIAATMESTFHVEPWMTAVALVVITTPIIFKGIKSVAAVSEWLVPIMTVVYALIAVAIAVAVLTAFPRLLPAARTANDVPAGTTTQPNASTSQARDSSDSAGTAAPRHAIQTDTTGGRPGEDPGATVAGTATQPMTQ